MKLLQKCMDSLWQYTQLGENTKIEGSSLFMFSWREKINGLKVYEQFNSLKRSSFGRHWSVKGLRTKTVS